MPGGFLRTSLPMPRGSELIDEAVVRHQLSSRGVDKVLRLAWTLADLAGRDRVLVEDVRAALTMRRGERLEAA